MHVISLLLVSTLTSIYTLLCSYTILILLFLFLIYYFIYNFLVVQGDVINPCLNSPCGPYSQCRVVNDHAVCSCLESCIGSPPSCHPECVVSADCPQDRSCVQQKCQDPCPGTCGINARCLVVNHNPICSCLSGYTGDPFDRCILEESKIFFHNVIFLIHNAYLWSVY